MAMLDARMLLERIEALQRRTAQVHQLSAASAGAPPRARPSRAGDEGERSDAGQSPQSVAVHTDLGIEEARARWKISGASMVNTARGKAMESGPLVEAAGVQFGLEIHWGGLKDSGTSGYFRIGVKRAPGGPKSVRAQFEVTVINQLNDAGHVTRLAEIREFIADEQDAWGWDDFMVFEDLFRPASGYCRDDTLIMELWVRAVSPRPRIRRFPRAPGQSARDAPGCSSRDGSWRGIGDDASAFLAAGQGTDVELRGSLERGEVGVRAHRQILAMRSPVFQRMLLSSGMQECKADAKVNIDGADRAILQKFIQFVYSDKLDDETIASSDLLCHLLSLAHRYEVRSLLERCSAELAASLTEESAIERLILAEQLGMPSLKEQVMGYLCASRTRLAQVQKMEPFTRMAKNYPQLILELFAQVVPPAEKKARPTSSS